MEQPELPGMPELPQAGPSRQRPGLRASKATSAQLCDDCCRLIHILGVAVAPHPQGGRWRVTDGSWIAFLCNSHKDKRMDRGQ